jgi:hypothetical protein
VNQLLRGQSRPLGPVNPFEVGVLLTGLVNGAAVLLDLASPTSITSRLSGWFLTGWALLLFLGSLVALIGLLWQGSWVTGVEIKRPGLVTFGIACLAYSVAAFSLGANGFAVGAANGGFALFAGWRVFQVSRGIRGLRADVAGRPRR